jgi:hypothetical protein
LLTTHARSFRCRPQVEAFAQELAQVSLAHVRVLRDILADQAAPCPAIDIGPAFAQAANQALNTQLQPPFDPYGALRAHCSSCAFPRCARRRVSRSIRIPLFAANDLFFFHAAFFLEDVAVTAHRGVIGMLDSEEFTSVLAGIMGADAYAAGAIRWRLSDRLAVVTPWNQPVWQVINAFSNWRQKLSGGCVARAMSCHAMPCHAHVCAARSHRCVSRTAAAA